MCVTISCSGPTISKWWVARAARPPAFSDVCGKGQWRRGTHSDGSASATQTHQFAIDGRYKTAKSGVPSGTNLITAMSEEAKGNRD